MEDSHRKRGLSSGTQSSAGNQSSKASEMSANSISANLKRLLDFSQTKLPGLYRTTSKYFFLEYCESDALACSKFHISSTQFDASFHESSFLVQGIQYCGYVKISFESSEELKIHIPGFRSYDPAGFKGQQYINSKQFLMIAKLLALEIRAAMLGVKQKRLEKIKKSIENVSTLPNSFIMLWNWMHLQVNLVAFKRISPPTYFEYIMNKILIEEFSLDGNDDCKEYLEKCFKGGEIKLPAAYYKAILKSEAKLPFEVRMLYVELENRENKDEKAAAALLNVLPRMINGLTVVKEGKSFNKMVSDCERLCKLYENNVHQNKCRVM